MDNCGESFSQFKYTPKVSGAWLMHQTAQLSRAVRAMQGSIDV